MKKTWFLSDYRYLFACAWKILKIMRLTVFLITLTCLQTFALSNYAQTQKLELKVTNATLTEVLDRIENQSDFFFFYNNKNVNLDSRLSLDLQDKTIKEVLNVLFAGTDISYTINNRQIILSGADAASAQQEKTITGQVKDSSGQALPGVTVVLNGTMQGTVTDFDGNYTISDVPVGSTLVFSFVGMRSQEIVIGNQSTINVVMAEDAIGIDEVVAIGYGSMKKNDLTGAISSVNSEDFTPGVNVNAIQSLNGTAAGVNVSQASSAPGGGIKIQIRGAGSINSSNSVLFVVDGLPGVDPQALSPEDIESIQVLKDASAAAIYGTRAANGVVLIKTKSGKAGKTTLSYSSYFGIQSVSKRLDVLGAEDYMRMINFRRDEQVYSSNDISSAGKGTNWQDEIFTDAPVQNHQVAMSGGNETGNYYMGLNYFDQDGIVSTSGYKKYNARFNIQSNPFEELQVSANINFTRDATQSILFSNAANENAGPINSAIQFDPTLPVGLDENGRYYLNPTIALDNPVALINGISRNNLRNTFYGSLNADYEFVKNLTATVRIGAELSNSRFDSYRNRETMSGLSQGGIGGVSTTEYAHWMTEYLLKYDNTFVEDHNFSIMLGTTLEEFITRNMGGSSAGFLSDVTGTDLLQSGDGEDQDEVNSSKYSNQLHGILGRMTYDYQNRYYLTLSFRVDGSSRFSEDNRYAFFPSGSVGWNISREPFMEEYVWLDNLKLRVGYGELGNQGIPNFATIQTLVANSGANAVFGGTVSQGVVPARLPNTNLKWETTAETNFGLDFSIFDFRLRGAIDYFNRKTTDQLFQKPLPSVVGFSNVWTNIGEVVNKGLELSLQTENIKGAFSWNTNLNMSFLKNEVTQLPDFTEEIITGTIGTFISNYTIVKVGEPLRAFYGYEIDGIFQEGDDISSSPTPDYSPGMPKFVNQNDDDVINADDRVVLGSPFPDFQFGIDNKFRYKNLSFNFFINGVQGIETLDANLTESLYPTNSDRNSISRFFLDRWTPDNPTNKYPSGENPSLYGGARAINSLTIRDASFMRLKNVTLGYTIPVRRIGSLSELKVSISGENLITITNYDGFDPDASDAGSGNVVKANYNSYPLAKTFRAGINVKF